MDLDAAVVDWSAPEAIVAQGPWQLVLSSDVLYERRNVDQMLELLPRLVDRSGEVWIADPGRLTSMDFLERSAHRARRNPGGAAGRDPLLAAASGEDLLQVALDRGAIGDSGSVRRPSRVAGPLRAPDHVAELTELAIRSDRDDEIAVRGGERPIRNDLRMRVAPPARFLTRHERDLGHVDQRREGRAEEIGLDMSPAPRAPALGQEGQDPGEGKASREEVRHGHSHFRGSAFSTSGDRHQPGPGLREEVEPGKGRLVADPAGSSDRRGHEARILAAEIFEREAELLQAPGQKVFDEDVRATGEDPHRLGARRRREVERDRFLVAVDGQVVGRKAGRRFPWRAPPARDVAAVGMLDLDDARSQVAEQHRAERSGQHPGEIENEKACERPGAVAQSVTGLQPSGPGRK